MIKKAKRPLGNVFPLLAFGLLAVVLVWAYWPGQFGPELLDDKSSMGVLRLLDDQAVATDIVFGDRSGPTGRPISMATFVVERLLLQEGMAGSKRVNIYIHAINGTLAVWFLWLLLRWERIPKASWVAVVFAGVWLFAPLHVSTVLYAVQRMAMLAAMFVLASCIAYLYWRQGLMLGHYAWRRFLLVPLFIMTAVFCKENALVVLPILLLMEALWLRYKSVDGTQVLWLKHFTWALILIGIAAAILLLLIQYDWLTARYGIRDYSLEERLLTQGRVVLDYARQFLWPNIARLGIYHDDFVVSASLNDPSSTFWAWLAWALVGLALVALAYWRQGRLLAFGAFFFLAGHSLESSVWPLEIYFEHRNYLPSIGLALLLATIVGLVGRAMPATLAPLLCWATMYLIVMAASTGSQVQIWSSEPLLVLTHLNGHPDSARANVDMATRLAKVGEIDAALRYSERAHLAANRHKAAADERVGDRDIRNLALSCLARKSMPVNKMRQIGQEDSSRPLGSVHTFHVLVQMAQDDTCPNFNWEDLSDHLASIYLVDGYPNKASPNLYSLIGALENALGNFARAYQYTEKFLVLSSNNTRGQLMQLHFTTALGKVEEAEALKKTLLEKQAQGELTVGEQQNLALYLE